MMTKVPRTHKDCEYFVPAEIGLHGYCNLKKAPKHANMPMCQGMKNKLGGSFHVGIGNLKEKRHGSNPTPIRSK